MMRTQISFCVAVTRVHDPYPACAEVWAAVSTPSAMPEMIVKPSSTSSCANRRVRVRPSSVGFQRPNARRPGGQDNSPGLRSPEPEHSPSSRARRTPAAAAARSWPSSGGPDSWQPDIASETASRCRTRWRSKSPAPQRRPVALSANALKPSVILSSQSLIRSLIIPTSVSRSGTRLLSGAGGSSSRRTRR